MRHACRATSHACRATSHACPPSSAACGSARVRAGPSTATDRPPCSKQGQKNARAAHRARAVVQRLLHADREHVVPPIVFHRVNNYKQLCVATHTVRTPREGRRKDGTSNMQTRGRGTVEQRHTHTRSVHARYSCTRSGRHSKSKPDESQTTAYDGTAVQ